MNVRNCMKCGKIFNYSVGRPICPVCRKELDDKFKDVKLFIKRNVDASIAEVSEKCDVETKQIKQWIREERLGFSDKSAIGIDCEVCGKTIKTGRFCDECKKTVTSDLQGAYEKPEAKKENPFARKKDVRMRFSDKK